jgi:redox-sensing transcriptional repressor
VARLPVYLRALTTLSEAGTTVCSSEDLAAAAGVNSAKLRKDLSYLGSYGTRGVGTTSTTCATRSRARWARPATGPW